MIKTFLIIVFLNEILTKTFTFSFSETQLPYIEIGQNNDIILYNPYQNTQKMIYHFFPKNNSILYDNYNEGQLLDFSKSLTNESKIVNGYYKSSTSRLSSFDVFYFNESYYKTFSINSKTITTYINFISLESIGPENLIYFKNTENANSINFADYKFNSTSKISSLPIKKYFTLQEKTNRTNCYCALTNNNRTVCGLIKIFNKSSYYDYNYTLVLFNENTNTYSEILIYNGSDSDVSNYENSFGVLYKFIKLIPLEDEKILYCYEEKGIICSLIQLEDQKLTILINQKIFYYSGTKKNIFSAIKYKDNQVILGILTINNNVTISKITIQNNKFLKEDKEIEGNISSCFYIKLLKNNYDEIILAMVSQDKIEFIELSYSRCNNVYQKIFNGNIVNINFDIYPKIDNDKDNIIIINNGKELNSLVVGKGENKINTSESYNINDLYFKLNSKDFDEINTYKKYSFEFSNSLNETISQRCFYTLEFYDCKAGCDICTSYDDCYDRNLNSINPQKEETKSQNYFIILGLIFGVLILIGLIIFIFIKCRKRGKMTNFGENANVNEMPLIEG